MKLLTLKRQIFRSALSVLFVIPCICGAGQDECIRGIPTPVFAKNHADIRSRNFTLTSSTEAKEQVQLKSGELIRISHGGCEYYTITFRFESNEILRSDTSTNRVYKEAADLLQKLTTLKVDSAFDLGLAAATLETALMKQPRTELHDTLAVVGDGEEFLQTQIRIDAAGRKRKIGFIEISLFKGPL